MKKSATGTFGILTSGGDCPGLNAAIRGVCLAACGRYGMKAVGINHGYRGLIEGDARPLSGEDFFGILTRGGTILGASREKPFKRPEGRRDSEVELEKVALIKEHYAALKLDCLVVLGGNGTHTTAHLLAKEGLAVVGLPKTIDNDIFGTDRTFGFNSAVSIATEAIDRLQSTAQSHNRVMVIELMGHKAGWLALYAGVAGGADVILIPEAPYDMSAVRKCLEERVREGRKSSIVVVAEGAFSVHEEKMEKKERKKYRQEHKDPSIGYRLAREIEEATGLETRATVLGYVQRGGVPSAFDRALATALGTAAADLLAAGDYGRMVALDGNKITSVDLSVPAGRIRQVPEGHYMMKTAVSAGICLGFSVSE